MATTIDLSPLEAVQQVLSIAREMGPSSLPEYTTPTRLQPVVLIDKSLTYVDDDSLPNILQTMLSIFTAHYLQAISLSTTINGIRTVELLDQFATERSLRISAGGGGYADKVHAMGELGNESHKLHMYPDTPALEARSNDSEYLQDHVNLAIGRLVHVELGVGLERITIPVTVSVNPRVIASSALPGVLTMVDQDTSVVGRYHKWRAGEINSFVDYIFALDLIEQDKHALLNDSSGIYNEARSRKTKGFFATLLSGRKSLNTASTMAVINKQTSEELELALKGRLSKPNVRNKYFVATNSMMLVVADPRSERLTIYQRGISNAGTYTYSDISNHSKKAGALDIASILKAYKLGNEPTL